MHWAKCAGKHGERHFRIQRSLIDSSSNCNTTQTPLWRRSPAGSTICNACGLYLKARNTSRPTNMKRPASNSISTPSSELDTPDHQRSTSPPTADGLAQSGRSTYVSAGRIPTGSCPGGGRCNGTGGADGCNGCPAYNNRVSKTTQVAISQLPSRSVNIEQARNDEPFGTDVLQGDASPRPAAQESPMMNSSTTSLVLSCQNCGTTITPLWRRDEGGRTICNACGKIDIHWQTWSELTPFQGCTTNSTECTDPSP